MSFSLTKCLKCRAIGDWSRDGICGACTRDSLKSVFDARDLSIREHEQIVKDAISFMEKDEVKPAAPGKPSISLIPREAILEMAKAFDYGTGKHGRYAFRDGVEFSKLLDAAMRHLLAMTDGEDVDEESGALHAACAMSNLSMLVYMIRNKPKFDDRWKKT